MDFSKEFMEKAKSICINHSDPLMRRKFLKYIDDTDTLKQILKNESDLYVKDFARIRLENLSFYFGDILPYRIDEFDKVYDRKLEEVINNLDDASILKTSYKQIDQEVGVKILTSDADDKVKDKAVSNIYDVDILEKIYINGNFSKKIKFTLRFRLEMLLYEYYKKRR